ncbi:hypothetical protein, conserved [Plasmodium gonderi]|uniref:Uncharacterized protein n=1 Tax=Plasmodium gonderi TaxID=77519 RepID=A0A1Y1JSX4_PLAGO|nr:hypothetical protein, conserved [Plasmodium gonderi]GAW83882.1 hypothetical protein, conserved [Plasmodium gonderi]
MNETFFSKNENKLTRDYHKPETDLGHSHTSSVGELPDVAKKDENGESKNGENINRENQNGENINRENQNGENINRENQNGENINRENQNGENQNGENINRENQNGENINRENQNGENINREIENNDDENYSILNMLNEIKKDLLTESEKLKQEINQNANIKSNNGNKSDSLETPNINLNNCDKNGSNQNNQSEANNSTNVNHTNEIKDVNNENCETLKKKEKNGDEVTPSNVKNETKEEGEKEEELNEGRNLKDGLLKKQITPLDVKINNQNFIQNEQSQTNINSKRGIGRPSKKQKIFPKDMISNKTLSGEPRKKRKTKNSTNLTSPINYGNVTNPVNATNVVNVVNVANSANFSRTQSSIIDQEIEYLHKFEFIKHNFLKGIEKNKSKEKSENINIDISYSSKSEKSLDESEGESSIESVEEFYENICQADMPLDFYKNPLSSKSQVNEVYPEYFLNTENSVTEEIQILNSYIKDITENQQNTSSSIDIDNKLLNILSLSFLTFIDHVIYDSHIYALKNKFTQDKKETQKKKKVINSCNSHMNEISQDNKMTQENEDRKKETDISNTPRDDNQQNGFDTKSEMYSEKVHTTRENNEKDDKIKGCYKFDESENSEKIDGRVSLQKESLQKEGLQRDDENGDTEHDLEKCNRLIYTPDIINLCLTNLYNQDLVNKIINEKKNEENASQIYTDVARSRENNSTAGAGNFSTLVEDSQRSNKLIQNNTTGGTEQSGKSENIDLKENLNEKNSKSGGELLKNKESLQTNINHKLNQRQIIINKINEKIKKKYMNNLQSFMNVKKYSLDDLFEL